MWGLRMQSMCISPVLHLSQGYCFQTAIQLHEIFKRLAANVPVGLCAFSQFSQIPKNVFPLKLIREAAHVIEFDSFVFLSKIHTFLNRLFFLLLPIFSYSNLLSELSRFDRITYSHVHLNQVSCLFGHTFSAYLEYQDKHVLSSECKLIKSTQQQKNNISCMPQNMAMSNCHTSMMHHGCVCAELVPVQLNSDRRLGLADFSPLTQVI